MPDATASYTTPPRPTSNVNSREGLNPRTTACGGRTDRETGHGCARHRGIIHSTKRGGGYLAHNSVWLQNGEGERAQPCQTSRHHTLHPPTHSKRKSMGETQPAHNSVWRQEEEGERARLCHTTRHHTLNREGLTHTQQLAAAERKEGVDTAVPDTAVSYTQTRGGWGEC